MSNKELIAKIKAEIERLKELHKTPTFKGDEYEEGGVNGYQLALDKILSFLSTLESEKPVPKDLEEYASRAGFDYVDNIVQEHPGHRFNDHDVEYAYRDAFIAGAKWQEEQDQETIELAEDHAYLAGAVNEREKMLKEAVEGIVVGDGEHCWIDANIPMSWMYQDKVRIIIIKEG